MKLELKIARQSIKGHVMIFDKKMKCISIKSLAKTSYSCFSIKNRKAESLYLKFYRAAEIVISILGVCFGMCLLPLILLGNRYANRGKLLYTQERIGLNGEKFQIYKFRTLRCDSGCNGTQHGQHDAHRVTAFGKFLRQSHLDEIPQFYNILMGEMRLIGPRPERPLCAKEFARYMSNYELRHQIKPGLTGWAQVNIGYEDTPLNTLEKLQHDLYYIENKGPLLDVSILLKTFVVIIFLKGE